MSGRVLVVHYHEIGLKGRNKANFEHRLRVNLDAALAGLDVPKVQRSASRLVIELPDPSVREEAIARVARVPGVVFVTDAVATGHDDASLLEAVDTVVAEVSPFESFRVTARRSSTDYPVTSLQLNIDIGRHVQEATGARVDLGSPQATVWIDIVKNGAFVFARRVQGVGGLPVGTAGTVIALLSSGIDSPVATWRIMKRGAVIVGVHFTGAPQTSDASEHTVIEIGHVLERAGGFARLYVVEFGDIQHDIALASPPDLRIILYRRMMVRVAEEIARIEGAKGLVTGESLGQVASQTLENIQAVDAVATLPVLRPLIGSDKIEIIDQARRIETYELSIQPGEDCCTLFMPRRPATHATVEQAHEGEVELDIPALVARAMANVRIVDFECRSYRAPRAAKRLAVAEASPDAPNPPPPGD